MKIIVLCVLVSIICSLSANSATSAARCPIRSESAADTLKNSEAVFLGEVVEIKVAGDLSEARFMVVQSWKGVETEDVTILSNPRLTESPRYGVGENYLVFAGLKDGQLFTGVCSRTRRLDAAQEDLKQLGEGKKPKAVQRSGER